MSESGSTTDTCAPTCLVNASDHLVPAALRVANVDPTEPEDQTPTPALADPHHAESAFLARRVQALEVELGRHQLLARLRMEKAQKRYDILRKDFCRVVAELRAIKAARKQPPVPVWGSEFGVDATTPPPSPDATPTNLEQRANSTPTQSLAVPCNEWVDTVFA